MNTTLLATSATLAFQVCALHGEGPRTESPAAGKTPEGPLVADQALKPPSMPLVNIFIEVQMVAIPREIAIPLIHDLTDAKEIDGACEKIQDLIANGSGKLIGLPMLTTQPGQRAVFEAIHECRYASEYQAGAIGVYYPEKNDDQKGTQVETKGTIFGTEFNSVPFAFETRNAGVTLEVEAVILPDGKSIQLNLVPQDVRLSGMKQVTLQRPGTADKVIVEQPEFETMKATTVLTVKSGQRVLLGAYPTADPANNLELFILEAEVRKVE